MAKEELIPFAVIIGGVYGQRAVKILQQVAQGEQVARVIVVKMRDVSPDYSPEEEYKEFPGISVAEELKTYKI